MEKKKKNGTTLGRYTKTHTHTKDTYTTDTLQLKSSGSGIRVQIFKTYTAAATAFYTMWSTPDTNKALPIHILTVKLTTMCTEWTESALGVWNGDVWHSGDTRNEDNAFMRSTNFWQTIKNTLIHMHFRLQYAIDRSS